MYQYVDIDGMRELVLGTGYVLVSLLPATSHLIDARLLANVFPFVLMLLFLAVIWFKRRVTYPRSGYAAPRRLSSYAVGLFAFSILFSFSNRLIPENAYLRSEGYPLFLGPQLSVTLLLVGQGLRRFYAYASVALALGVGSTIMGLEPDLGMSLTALATGLLLLASGGRMLRRYLATYPPPEER